MTHRIESTGAYPQPIDPCLNWLYIRKGHYDWFRGEANFARLRKPDQGDALR